MAADMLLTAPELHKQMLQAHWWGCTAAAFLHCCWVVV